MPKLPGSVCATAVPATWVPGATFVEVEVACCPKCGNTDVECRGRRKTGAMCIWWQCRCAERWKTTRPKVQRAIMA